MSENDFGVALTALQPEQVFDRRLLRVPDFQRGYAWQWLQWEEFLEDLELIPEGRVHYTGTIVLHATGDAPVKDRRGSQYQVFEVVDGQQRLTTIVLILDAVRREMVRLGEHHLAEGIRETFIAVTDRDGQPLPKLRLNEDTHDYFFDHILNDKPCLSGTLIRSHLNLREAKDFFEAYLRRQAASLGDGYRGWLENLRERVCFQLNLNVYAINEESDAGVIFEVMNNRGKPITELEKVKNYLLYLSSKLHLGAEYDLAKRINSTWGLIFQRLMSSGLGSEDSENQLLRVHWLMAYDPLEKNWNGSKSLKQKFHLREYVNRHEDLLEKLKEYVDGLRDAALAFCDVANPRHPDAFGDLAADPALRTRVARFAEKLPRLRVLAPFLPLLIAVRLRHPGDGQKYLAALQACERYAFRVFRLLQRRANAGRPSLFAAAHKLFIGQSPFDEALNVMNGLMLYHGPNYAFEKAFDLEAARDWYKWVGLKYFLYEYEEHRAGTEKRDMAIEWSDLEVEDAKTDTIEHILPQTPTDDYWTSRFNPGLQAKYTHDLGNLCLTRDNSSYGNKPFPAKRGSPAAAGPCYAKGNLVMERDLAALTDWTEVALLERRKKIVEAAQSRWGVKTPQVEVPVIADEEEEEDSPEPGVESGSGGEGDGKAVGNEPTSRDHWVARSSPDSLKAADRCVEIIGEFIGEFVPRLGLNYRRGYIGLADEARSQNFILFYPKTLFVRVDVKISDQQPWLQKLDAAGLLLVRSGKPGTRVKFRLTDPQIHEHRTLLRSLFEASYQEYRE